MALGKARTSALQPIGKCIAGRVFAADLGQQQEIGRRVRAFVRMGLHQHMGEHYPFTLADKLAVITEPCAWYTAEGGPASPWGRAIIPMEMISVLLGSSMDLAGFRGKGPAVGLFAGQEIRIIAGPLFVDHPYELEREIVALSESARTESVWVRTRIRDGVTQALVGEMILNSATLKASYAAYEAEARALGKA